MIIYRQGRSSDRWLARNWRRNREAVCIRRRSIRTYLFQLGRKSEAARKRNRSCGGKALPIKADSASADYIRAAVDQVVKEFGELDILVNNAGILIRVTVGSYSLEDLDRMLDINVLAAFVGIQAASEHMKDGGRIILIGSNTAVRPAFPGASVYSMTKAALTLPRPQFGIEQEQVDAVHRIPRIQKVMD